MTAPTRRRAAAKSLPAVRIASAQDLWQEAVTIREEWLRRGLSTEPADRLTTERSLTQIYARVSRPQPRFVWVDSPVQALPLITGLPDLEQLYEWIRAFRPPSPPSLASDLATAVSRLRSALSAGVTHSDPEVSPARRGKDKEPWREVSPREAFSTGVPFGVLLHQGIRGALHRSLFSGFCQPVRTALTTSGALPTVIVPLTKLKL